MLTYSTNGGKRIIIRQQGKKHPAEPESNRAATGVKIIGYRPAQWIIGYQWSEIEDEERLWLSASVCYDATDLSLAAGLRNFSDVFAVPAFNKDVNTFDQMALALHYHMFQYVVIANNGEYGGSNVYAPYDKPFERQVLHLHGQPQASAAFFEINEIKQYIDRNKPNVNIKAPKSTSSNRGFKTPPAGIDHSTRRKPR